VSRSATYSLVAAGVLFLLYPVLRPWEDEATGVGAQAALASPWWIPAHLCAMIGFVLVPLALMSLRDVIGQLPATVMAIGAALTLTYYGAEAFALHSLAKTPNMDPEYRDFVEVVQSVRYEAWAVVAFGLGLLGLAVGAVMTARRIHRSGVLSPWCGALFAAGFVLFLPQFFFPAPVRIAHGVLMLAGLLWLAWGTRDHNLGSTGSDSKARTANTA
jgi:hypothetical protein